MTRFLACCLCAAAVLASSAPPAAADIETNFTTGRNGYLGRSLDFNFNLAPHSRLTLGSNDYRSDTSPYFAVYWGTLEFMRQPCFNMVVNLIIRPEHSGYDFFGWELIPKISRKDPGITLAFGFKRYLHTQNVAVPAEVERFLPVGVRETVTVAQNWAEPDISIDVTSRLNLGGSYRYYFYDKDPVDLVNRFGYTFLSNVDFTGASTVILGFPGKAYTLRAKYAFSSLFSLEVDFTELYLVVRQIYSDTWLYTFTYTASSRVQMYGKYNLIDSRDRFYTLGAKWLW